MYEIKKQIYLNFTKNQKASLLTYLRAMVKNSPTLSSEDIWEKFVYDEKYYLEMDCSRFEFLKDIIDDDSFKSDTMKYIKECKKYYEYKEKQRPIIEANKAYEKQKRKFLKEVKMSKEPPTKKQLYYYDRLCKKYGLERRELESKLDARNEIDKIINEHNEYYMNISKDAEENIEE